MAKYQTHGDGEARRRAAEPFIRMARRGLWQRPEFIAPTPPSVALEVYRVLTADGYRVLFGECPDNPGHVNAYVRVADDATLAPRVARPPRAPRAS